MQVRKRRSQKKREEREGGGNPECVCSVCHRKVSVCGCTLKESSPNHRKKKLSHIHTQSGDVQDVAVVVVAAAAAVAVGGVGAAVDVVGKSQEAGV